MSPGVARAITDVLGLTETTVSAIEMIEPGVPRSEAWMQTFTGKRFYPLEPRAEDIDPLDIAHALSNICRYGGHARRYLSVAEHCVVVSRVVSPENALWGLLHDASEAYVGDMIRPIKHTDEMAPYRDIENGVHLAVAERFNLPPSVPAEVVDADTRVLLNERAVAITPTPFAWGIEHLEPFDVTYECWNPAEAKAAWLRRFNELCDEDDL